MEKNIILDALDTFKERLVGEVISAYQTRGNAYGRDRFNTWRRKFSQFLDEVVPGESSTLNAKLTHYSYSTRDGENDAERFWRVDGDNMVSYIDSLILDIQNDEYDLKEEDVEPVIEVSLGSKPKNKVFIVHGHDGETKERTARFIEKLGFEAVILHEQASRGMTIIEKIEKYSSEVDFGIVLYTPDDMGNAKSEAESGELKYRARQNVVFEHGFLIGKLGRNKVAPLVEGAIELPNDISGIVYINDQDWQRDIAKEMKSAGYEIDFNKLF
ncbi:nucleotide-binding protein [Photobacterium phosphoreum]|uniref:nucleotide-binding protein n=1 Tax=Photobacterium phosphoreum TaxID=659 RepID=UPI0024B68FAC|nr:nucleotide-binding protein [Photobacterium phosphoreum]